MSDEAIMAAALAITAVFSAFFYKYQKKRKTRKQKFIEKAKAEGNFTEGEYEDCKVYLGVKESSNSHFRNDTLKVKYKYTVGGKTYYKYMPFQSPGMANVNFPVRVEVFYDPQNPKKAVCPQEATPGMQRRSGCLISIAAAFAFLFVVFHILRFIIRAVF